MPKLNFIDVFAGAGGLSCGMEMAGMRCLLGVDHDKHAMATFARNHKHAEVYCGDITKLTKKKLFDLIGKNKIHAVVGGPPCQGFSTVGTGDPKDQRNSLFLQFVRIVKLTKPEFVVMENVTGLLAKKNEKTLQAIFKRFSSLGYHMGVQVMSAEKYGVPEKRRRTIIIGSKINEEPVFPKPSHDVIMAKTYRPPCTVGDALKSLKTKKGELFNHDLEMAKVSDPLDQKRLKKIPEGQGIRYEKDEKKFLPPKLRLGVDWKNMREGRFRQTKYYRLDRQKPSPTIMTHRHSYYHPVEPRFLTQREAAALQSFPNDFVFEGPLSAQWRQIGNAVPPLLGKAIGKALLNMHKKGEIKAKTKKKGKVETDIHSIRGKAFVYGEA
jgi:DNA (cytosine-5)-methyltransferase 1